MSEKGWQTQSKYLAVVIERLIVLPNFKKHETMGYIEIPKGHLYYGKHKINLSENDKFNYEISCTGNAIPRDTEGWWLGFEIIDDNHIEACETVANFLKRKDKKHKLKNTFFISSGIIIMLTAICLLILTIMKIFSS